MNISSIGSVVYFVTDIPKTAEWYQKVLGHAPARQSDSLVVFELGKTQLILHPADRKAGQATGAQVAYWQVDDVELAKVELESHGAKVYRKITKSSLTNELICQLQDPFGNIIGLVQSTNS